MVEQPSVTQPEIGRMAGEWQIIGILKIQQEKELHGAFHSHGDTPQWMVYEGKSIYKWMMIWGYHYFRKPPYDNHYLDHCKINSWYMK